MIKTLLLTAILFTSIMTAQPIRDIIHPINLSESNPVTVLLSDLFYVKDYSSIKFYEHPIVDINFDKLTMNLTLSPKGNVTGLHLIEFTLDARDYFIPVVMRKVQRYDFTFVTKGKPEKVNLFGQFNSWNRQNIPMTESEPGVFRVNIPLDPGRYEYKYFVDGKEIIDSLNPVYVSNGWGIIIPLL